MIIIRQEQERQIEEFIAQFLIETFYEEETPNFVTASLSGTTSQILAQNAEAEQKAVEYLEFDDRPPFTPLALEDIKHGATCKRSEEDYLFFNEKQGDARNVYIPDNLTKITFEGFPDESRTKDFFRISQTNVDAWNDSLEKMFQNIIFNGYSNISYSSFFRILYPYSLAYKLMMGPEYLLQLNSCEKYKKYKINEIKSYYGYEKILTTLAYSVARVMIINRQKIENNAEIIKKVINCDNLKIEHSALLDVVALTTAANKMDYNTSGFLFKEYQNFIKNRCNYIERKKLV